MRTLIKWVCLLLMLALATAAPAATVSGIVTAASGGQALAGASVILDRYNGLFYETLATTTTNAQGEYAVTHAFVGSARVRASAQGYLETESSVVMPAGTGTVSIFLSLPSPAIISGRVSNEATGQPLAGVRVRVLSSQTQRYVDTVADGSYAATGLTPGDYSVCVIDNHDAFMNQCWDHVTPNSLVAPTNDVRVNVVAGQVQANINLDLRAGGGISGVILNRRTGLPVNSPTLQIHLRTAANNHAQISVSLDANGHYEINGLAPGSYHAVAQSASPYFLPQLYAGLDCTGSDCDFPLGTSLVIATPSTILDDVDFSILPGARLQGQVKDRASSTPIAGATVELWRREPFFGTPFRVGSVLTNSAGNYALDHVDSTVHLVVAYAATHIPQRYPDVSCFTDCTSTAQGGISVAPGSTTQMGTMRLDRGARISGQARLPGLSANAFTVTLYDAAGQWQGQVAADASGAYQFPARAPGTVYLRSSGNAQQCQTYRWMSCAIPPTSGTPVVLATPTDAVTADFDIFIDQIQRIGFETYP